MRIVVIRTSALGDTVLTTPLLRELHLRLDAKVELVTSPPLVSLFEGLPFLDRVWGWGREESVSEFSRKLGAGAPVDVAVDLQNKIRTFALLLRLGAGRNLRFVKRRGLGRALSSLMGAGPVLDDRPAASLYFQAVAPLGILPGDLRPKVHVCPERRARLQGSLGAEEGPLVALAPGARWALKRWAPENFARVGEAMARAGARLVLVGGPGDREDVEAVRSHLASPIPDTLEMGLEDLAALLSLSHLLVTGDSGPSHLAQAVGTPVVSVFGPTSSRRWGPAEGAGAVVSLPLACSPCSNYGKGGCAFGDRACLDQLPADAVIEVASAALGAGRFGGGLAGAKAARDVLLPLAMQVSRMSRGSGR